MTKKQEQDKFSVPEVSPTIIDDPTIAGILIAKEIKIVPFADANKRVHFAAYGNVQKALQEIYEDRPCGSLSMLNGVKSARGMIWNLKGGAR